MNIKFSNYDLSSFGIKDGNFCGQDAILVTPRQIGTKFDQQNKIFRSSIWTIKGELLSAGFKKFVNLGENPEHFPVPKNLKNTNIVDKIDGSLVIVDYFNNQLNMRTRGIFDYKKAENAADFEHCLNKYSKIEALAASNPHVSWLYEIVTPNNKIVLKYPEIDMILIGAMDKTDYSLFSQYALDDIAEHNDLKRPIYYSFKSLDELIIHIKNAKGIEGCCLYSKGDQEIHKIKSEDYLVKHRLKDELCNPERVLDVWFRAGKPSYKEFENYVINNFDYEIFDQVKNDISKICDAVKITNNVINGMRLFLDRCKNQYNNKDFRTNRKSIAQEIYNAYGGEKNNRATFCFTLLDHDNLSDEQLKKIILQVIKK